MAKARGKGGKGKASKKVASRKAAQKTGKARKAKRRAPTGVDALMPMARRGVATAKAQLKKIVKKAKKATR